jgi:HNH endonuclease/AP2 domain
MTMTPSEERAGMDNETMRKVVEAPSPELLRKLLRYEPETGYLYWRPRPAEMFASDFLYRMWTAKYANKRTFAWVNHDGYKAGAIYGQNLLAHRVIWAMQTGAWPADQIDHINCERDDNRWVNLRAATREENQRNTRGKRGSSSLYLGVCWSACGKRWVAQINAEGKKKHLGRFHSEVEAAKAYDAAAAKYHGEFARLNFPADVKEMAK